MFKTIFGIMDADDAEYFENAINQVQNDEKKLIDLLKSQIQVVKVAVANFNESMSKLKLSEKTFNENISKFNKLSKQLTSAVNNLTLSELITQHLTLLTYLITEVNEELDNLINSILFAKKSILHPSVMSPIQLATELIGATSQYFNGLSLPVSATVENAHIILDISELQVYYTNGKLIFIVSIPLTEETPFHIYRLIPLPIPHNDQNNLDKSYAYIQPSFNYLAVTQNRLKYLQLNNIRDCKTISNEHFICKGNTYHIISEKLSCEAKLFVSAIRDIPRDCNTKLFYGNIEAVESLKFNQWLLVSSKAKYLTVACENEQKILNTNVMGTCLITLNNSCKAYLDTIQLIPQYVITSEFQSVIPQANILEDDCCLQNKLNISHEYMSLKPISLSNIDLNNLKLVSHTLHQMNQKIEEAQAHPQLIRYPSTFTIIIYSVVGVLALYTIYKLYKKLKPENSCANRCLINIFNQCHREQRQTPNLELSVNYQSRESISNESEILHERPRPRVTPRRPLRTKTDRSFNLEN